MSPPPVAFFVDVSAPFISIVFCHSFKCCTAKFRYFKISFRYVLPPQYWQHWRQGNMSERYRYYYAAYRHFSVFDFALGPKGCSPLNSAMEIYAPTDSWVSWILHLVAPERNVKLFWFAAFLGTQISARKPATMTYTNSRFKIYKLLTCKPPYFHYMTPRKGWESAAPRAVACSQRHNLKKPVLLTQQSCRAAPVNAVKTSKVVEV